MNNTSFKTEASCNLAGAAVTNAEDVKGSAITKTVPRRTFEVVCDDLVRIGLVSATGDLCRTEVFFAGDDDFCIVHEREDRTCRIIFSDQSVESLRNNSCCEVPIGINLRNRRQWRIVKPLVRSIYRDVVCGDGYKLFAEGWESICEADSSDLDEMMPEEFWEY